MTVIAWDGKTLAADRRATNCGVSYSVSKLARVRGCLIGFSGEACQIGRYLAWFESGGSPETFPPQVKDSETYMLVVWPNRTVERYEETGYPLIVQEPTHAMGSGRDFAMAAMHLGFNAVSAVECASALCYTCGNGVDTLTFDDARGDA